MGRGRRRWGWVDPKTWKALCGISCSQTAALMINGAVENSSLGLFFFPDLRARFRSSKCPRVMLPHSSGPGGLHPHLDGCLGSQAGQVGTGPGNGSTGWDPYVLGGRKGPWGPGATLLRARKVQLSSSMDCSLLQQGLELPSRGNGMFCLIYTISERCSVFREFQNYASNLPVVTWVVGLQGRLPLYFMFQVCYSERELRR